MLNFFVFSLNLLLNRDYVVIFFLLGDFKMINESFGKGYFFYKNIFMIYINLIVVDNLVLIFLNNCVLFDFLLFYLNFYFGYIFIFVYIFIFKNVYNIMIYCMIKIIFRIFNVYFI